MTLDIYLWKELFNIYLQDCLRVFTNHLHTIKYIRRTWLHSSVLIYHSHTCI